MVKRSAPLIALALALVAVVMATPAPAQTRDQRTYFTFSGPIALPDVTLPAGKYLFRLADVSDRHIVQVYSADGRTLYKTMIAIPAHRLDPTSEPEVRFMEAPANVAPPIQTWWYPGNSVGHEFIYPKEQARRIAEAAHQPVLTTHAEVPVEQAKPSELARVTPSGEEVPVEKAPETPTGRPQPGTLAPETLTLPPPAAPTMQMAKALPKTASPLPFIGLIGLLSLGAALAMSLRARVR